MSIHAQPPGRRALAVTVVAGACLAAALALDHRPGADAYDRLKLFEVGALQLTGDAASDTLDAPAQGTTANTLACARSTAQLVFDLRPGHLHRGRRRRPRGGNDTVIGQNGHPPLEKVTLDGGAGDDTLAAATAPTRCSAAPATTSSTATSAPTPR